MNGGKIYKYAEFGILVLGIALFVRYSGISFQDKKARAFEWEKEVNIYLSNGSMGSSGDCSKVFPVKRKVPNAEILGPGALDALLKGASAEEKAKGYSTSINNGVLLQKFEVKGKIAYADFNHRFSETAGSCNIQAMQSQVANTLSDLPSIGRVVMSVNGETKGILEP
jgi:hypothetical protein